MKLKRDMNDTDSLAEAVRLLREDQDEIAYAVRQFVDAAVEVEEKMNEYHFDPGVIGGFDYADFSLPMFFVHLVIFVGAAISIGFVLAYLMETYL